MEQLRIHVERIVRPIRAAAGRKNKMREEIFAHLAQKAEALIDAGAEEPAAYIEAIEQLGDPAALRADLQATVPAIERLAYARLPDFGVFDAYFEKTEGESALHFALVRTAFIASAIAVCFLALLAARWSGLLPHHANSPAYCAMMITVSYLSVVLSSFVSYYLADVTGLRRLMSRKTPGRAWIKGGVLCLFMCAEIALMLAPIVLFIWIVNPADAIILLDVFSGVFGRRWALGILLALLVAFPILSIAMKYEHEQWLKWGSLRIDD